MHGLAPRTRSLVPLSVKQRMLAMRDPRYRAQRRRDETLEALGAMPRHQAGTTELLGARFHFLDGRSFRDLYREIFVRELYKFTPATPTPLILDCGANVGLATRYWKATIPASRVIAFEPDPVAVEIFRANMRAGGLTDVDLQCAAVWVNNEAVPWSGDNGDAGRVAGHVAGRLDSGSGSDSEEEPPSESSVAGRRLRDFLTEPIDLLKMDIEGAEVDVLIDCADRLVCVDRLFVEYHGFAGREQRLVELLTLLEGSGFRSYVQHEGRPAPRPFVEVPTMLGMDVQLNIFCTRNATERETGATKT